MQCAEQKLSKLDIHVVCVFQVRARGTDPVQGENPASLDSRGEDIDGPPGMTTHHVRCCFIHLQ